MSALPLFRLDQIRLAYGEQVIFSGLDLSISVGERIALVGRNGSGKSTLMKVMAGFLEADEGEVFRQPGTQIEYLEQEPQFGDAVTVQDYLERPARLQTDDATIVGRRNTLIDLLDVDPGQAVKSLSGGEARRIALIDILSQAPDILLLDEPTNHLDIHAIEWLEGYLKSLRSALMIISHDRRFLEGLSNKTVWIDRGLDRQHRAGFGEFESWRDKVLEEEELEAHKLGRKIVAEEHWVRYGVTARRKRNVRRMRELQELREAHANARRGPKTVTMLANESDASGKIVIEAKDLSKSFGAAPIVDAFSIKISRGDRIGLVGANGSGKTTLINLLTDKLTPDAGSLKLGATVDLVTLDQKRTVLKPEMRVGDVITGGRGDFVNLPSGRKHVATYLKDFLFGPDQWRAPVGALSGGERGRLALAAALATPANLLVLDEPTNDLDLETLDVLQEMLSAFEGTLILVSHDRSFLDRTVTSVIARSPIEKPGSWQQFVGGYTDFMEQSGRNNAPPSSEKVKAKSTQKNPANSGSNKPSAPQQKPTKLSYKDNYALEKLPEQITALETRIQGLQKKLTDDNFYQRDPEGFQKTATALDKARNELSDAEEEWLRLEIKRDELAGG